MVGTQAAEIAQAKEAASKAELAIVVVGESNHWGDGKTSTNGEGRDAATLELTGLQEDLVKAVHATGTPTVVVLVNGRPLAVRWIAEHVPAVVEAWLPGSQVYAAGLVWPSNQDFPQRETAFVHIAGEAGKAVVYAGHSCGPALFLVVNLALLVAQTGSGAGAHLAAGRLLYGMGRDNAIPCRFFGALHPRSRIPRNNIVLVGALALAGALTVCIGLMSFDLGCEMLNFGALIGFMGVNLSALVRYYVRGSKKNLLNLVLPIMGFVVCLYLWLNLARAAQLAGLAWLAVGFLYGAPTMRSSTSAASPRTIWASPG